MKPRILVICPYYPPHIGGLESHADEFNEYLAKNGFEITVFTPRLPKEAIEKENKYKHVEIIRFPAWEIIPNYPLPCFWNKKFWNLWKNLKTKKYDWVISRTRFFLTSVMAGCFAKKNKTRWLHIEHGSDFVKLNNPIKSFLGKFFDYTFGRCILKNANEVVANSKASAYFCKKLYSFREYKYIYRGVELGKIENNLEIQKKYKDKVKIIFAGRLIDGKGVQDLIKAVSKISLDNWVLLIIGDGPMKNDLEKYVKDLELESKIKFLGQMERSNLMGIINVGDIVVNPSYTEGLPTSVIEAAKCGKAIIATDVGGTREIIENYKSGILILAKRPDILTQKIELLIINTKLREQLGQEARKKVENSFDWNVSIKKYIDIFTK